MSVLVVGVSHRSAPVSVLERVALDGDAVAKVAQQALDAHHVSESLVVSTCNRVEIYVEAERFHGSVEDISDLLVEQSGLTRNDLLRHIYVHYDDAAVAHLFSVASGLDSMVVGESQILGQVRAALQRGQDDATVGPALNVLFQQALRIAKRGHAETDIDRAGPSLVMASLELVAKAGHRLEDMRVLVVGAGAMAALSATTAARRGVASVTIANRTHAGAERLAATVGGTAVPWGELDAALAEADLVVSCTGATGSVITAEQVRAATTARTSPYVLIDLALPRDIDEDVAALPGVMVLGLAQLQEMLADEKGAADIDAVRGIVAGEVAAFLAARHAAKVTPTVVALRSMATAVVDAELVRLEGRLHDVDPEVVDELRQAVRRVADKLLHQPTVRIKAMAGRPDALTYANALADLFALDPAVINAVSAVEPTRSTPAAEAPEGFSPGSPKEDRA
ncbi:glutamyl-tRNA reductase [Mumia sp. zg.B17]|uniref:glutamyl-tRNA reductase n=1 Tax=Mumia sp. zg.B17 TaxID=2855446 RepID=UPI001C6F5827|nr:glutamyl-tRNA reductase [Mumia sp. zg.B17]MBW9204534.1 glutamyl-tRNA reductase [Mumia sp. zg.B17]